jgi:lipopolysaccharide assembly protein B
MTITGVILFLLSVGIAWLLGYRMRKQAPTLRKINLPRDYLMGLNFLLNEETDKAVDVFIKMLEVDSDTVETHLTVGKLFRRRGEVDRAIRIHQNLIARPQLEKRYREQSLYELGQDYLSAGMLDRAERIFIELTNSKQFAASALKTLIDIYQQEKDWENAVKMAEKYEFVTGNSMQPVIAHYYCELADDLITNQQSDVALEYLDKASGADLSCVRASLMKAKIYIARNDYKNALRHLKMIKDQNHHFLSEAIDLIALCYEQLGSQEKLIAYFKKLIDEYPKVPVVLILAERIRQWKGDKVAANFVADYVRRYPSIRGLSLFINLYISSAQGQAKEDLHILQNLMKKILSHKPDYRCHSCGFSGKSLHWQCPGCREWSTIMPIHSLAEENT